MTAALQPVTDPAPPAKLPVGVDLPPLRDRWTAGGPCVFREARVPIYADAYMKGVWKANRKAFLERGFSIKLHNDVWHLQQWLAKAKDGTLALTYIGQEKLNALLGPAPDEQAPLPLEDETAALDLAPLAAHLEAKLFDYQINPARQLVRALANAEKEWGYPGAWDCSDLGTGKTYQALAAAIHTGLEVGVICPLSVIPAWKAAFRHFGQIPKFIANYEGLRTGNRGVVIKETYQHPQLGTKRRFAWQLAPRDTILLFDEVHMAKNAGTLNQALLTNAIRQRFPLICISGTLANDPTHMRATGRAVGLHQGGPDYHRFLKDHGCYGAGESWKFCGGVRGRKILAHISRTVFPMRGARTRIADLGDRFPETQIMAEAYETGETQQIAAAFAAAEDALEKLEAQGVDEGKIAALRMISYMEAWQQSERCKVASICEMVARELDEGRSVVVFCSFIETRETLMRKLKTGCAIFGGQPPFHREQCIADFQADRARVMIANIKAGGVGLSLHDVNGDFPRTSIILPSNEAVAVKQALGRIHRAGGRSRSRQIILFAAGTIEEKICAAVRVKLANFDALNDGDFAPPSHF